MPKTKLSTGDTQVDSLLKAPTVDLFQLKLQWLSLKLDKQYKLGRTLLMELLESENLPFIEALLQHSEQYDQSVGMNVRDDAGLSAIFYPIRSGNRKLLELLVVTFNADLSVRTGTGLCIFNVLLDPRLTNLIPEVKNELVLDLLQLGAPVPTLLNSGLSIIEEVLYYTAVELEQKALKKPAADHVVWRIITELEGVAKHNGNKDAFEGLLVQCSVGGNVLHECVSNYLPTVLEYFLALYKAKGDAFLKDKLETSDDSNWTPVLCCCSTNHDVFNSHSRLPLLKKLIQYGAEFDKNIPTRDMTPLQFITKRNRPSAADQETACFLIDQGANVFQLTKNIHPPAYFIITKKGKMLLEHVLRNKLIPVDTTFRWYSCESYGIREAAAFVSNEYRDVPPSQLQKTLQPAIRCLELLFKYKFNSEGSLFFLLAFEHSPAGRFIFKTLLQLGAAVNYSSSLKLPLVPACVAVNDFRYFQILLRYGADVKARKELHLCLNQPPHRPSTFASFKEKNIAESASLTRGGVCCLCLQRFPSTGKGVTSCSAAWCDFLLCELCWYFKGTQDHKRYVDSLILARRKSDVRFHNHVRFLVETGVGVAVQKLRLIKAGDILLHAGIHHPSLVEKLTPAHMRRLGLKHSEVVNLSLGRPPFHQEPTAAKIAFKSRPSSGEACTSRLAKCLGHLS